MAKDMNRQFSRDMKMVLQQYREHLGVGRQPVPKPRL